MAAQVEQGPRITWLDLKNKINGEFLQNICRSAADGHLNIQLCTIKKTLETGQKMAIFPKIWIKERFLG